MSINDALEPPELKGECIFLTYAFNVKARCCERLWFILPAILTIGLKVDHIDFVVLDDDYVVVLDNNQFTPPDKNLSLVEKLVEIILEGETRLLANSKTVAEIFNLDFKQELFNKVQFELNQLGLELKTFQIGTEFDSINQIVLNEFQSGRTTEVITELGMVCTFWYLPPAIKNKVGLLQIADGNGVLCQLITNYEEKIAFSPLEKLLAAVSGYKKKLEREKQVGSTKQEVEGGGVSALMESLRRDYVYVGNYLQSMSGMFQEVLATIKAE